MTPHVYILRSLRAIFVAPIAKLKWLFSDASRNPCRGEIATKGCLSQIILLYTYSYLRTLEDFNHKWTGRVAHEIDLKLYQVNPELYMFIFEHDLFMDLRKDNNE